MLKHATAITLLAAAGQVGALTLGTAQGQVVIGRPLELVVMAGASDAAAGQCLQAEVHYGDSRLPAAEVTVTTLAPDESGAIRWRVRASQPVNEPIVTLQMRVGCANAYTRSYALLADQDSAALSQRPVSEAAARTRARAASAALAARSAGKPNASDQGGRPAVSARPRKPGSEPPSRRTVSPAPINLPPPRPRPFGVERALAKTRPAPVREEPVEQVVAEKPAATPAMPATTGPRLELDLIETAAMPLQPAVNSTAAAGSLPGPAGTVPADAEPLGPVAPAASLQAELEGLRVEQARMRAAVEAVHAQLAQARPPRWQDPLVLGLLGLSTASLLALAWTWVRLQRQRWA